MNMDDIVTVNGVTKTVLEFAEDCGITMKAFHARMQSGWDLEKALTTKKMWDRKTFVKRKVTPAVKPKQGEKNIPVNVSKVVMPGEEGYKNDNHEGMEYIFVRNGAGGGTYKWVTTQKK